MLASGRFEAPLVAQLMRYWREENLPRIFRLNADFLASRESAELRAETVQMGFSLRRLSVDLGDPALSRLCASLAELPETAFPTIWSGLAAMWGIAPPDAVAAYLWAWLENQAMAALKAVPLGQAAGQRMLAELGETLPEVVEIALSLPEDEWSSLMPGFALCSARHETQYSRIFRS
jgi:urease accessory protein